jgi:mannonate dehydratase
VERGRKISRRRRLIAHRSNGEPSALRWDVVESLPVSEDIKKQKGEWRAHLESYRQSPRNLSAAGIETVCYNSMPVLHWTRTALRWPLATGATCMRFDIHILRRAGAERDFEPAVVDEAVRRHAAMSGETRQEPARSVTMGLPGSTESMDLARMREHLAEYGPITRFSTGFPRTTSSVSHSSWPSVL